MSSVRIKAVPGDYVYVVIEGILGNLAMLGPVKVHSVDVKSKEEVVYTILLVMDCGKLRLEVDGKRVFQRSYETSNYLDEQKNLKEKAERQADEEALALVNEELAKDDEPSDDGRFDQGSC